MPSPAQLVTWFNVHLGSLETIDREVDHWHNGVEYLESFESSVNRLFEDLPVGINEYNVPYHELPFKKSGPSGWTYYPADVTGIRLARMSCASPIPNVYVRILVKLVPDKSDSGHDAMAGTEVYTYDVADRAILIIDNITGHGRVDMRQDNPVNKRRKLCIKH